MSTAREIRTKIGSIQNTKKITHAMELVAASKMRKAQERMVMSRPYAKKIRHVISHVATSHAEYQHPYMQERKNVKRVGFIIVTTDRGLCGGLNINLFRKTLMEMKQWHEKKIGIDICVIGRKAEVFFGQQGANILGSIVHLGDKPAVQDIIGVVKIMLEKYEAKSLVTQDRNLLATEDKKSLITEDRLDRIYICANEFVNTMIQKPLVRQLLPLQKEIASGDTKSESQWDYLYEPDSAKTLLTLLLIRYIESQVYQAVVENIACEQAARMIAMKNATDNAKEIISELQLAFNKARQAGITREIAEIVAGAAALE